MGLKGWIIPQERQFFDLLEKLAATVDEGAVALADLLHDFRDVPMKCRRIKDGTRLLKEAVGMIRNMKQANGVERIAIEVHRLENVADDLMNNAVAALFHQEDPVTIIKFKEITEVLEQATDHCEDVANVLSDIVAKNQ